MGGSYSFTREQKRTDPDTGDSESVRTTSKVTINAAQKATIE